MKYRVTKIFNGAYHADAVNPYPAPIIQNGMLGKIIPQDNLYWEFEETNFIYPAFGFTEEGEYEEGKDCLLLEARQARFIASLNGHDHKVMPIKGNVLVKLRDSEGNYTSIEDLGHVHAKKWSEDAKDYEQKYAEFMYAFMLGAENMKNVLKKQGDGTESSFILGGKEMKFNIYKNICSMNNAEFHEQYQKAIQDVLHFIKNDEHR